MAELGACAKFWCGNGNILNLFATLAQLHIQYTLSNSLTKPAVGIKKIRYSKVSSNIINIYMYTKCNVYTTIHMI